MTFRRFPGGIGIACGVLSLYAGVVSAGLNRWTTNGPYGGYVAALAVDPTRAETAYAGIPGFGVFKTTDGGVTWSSSSEGLRDPSDVPVYIPLGIQALAIDPNDPATLYAGLDQGGVYKSTDGAATWHRLEFASVFGLAIDPRSSSTLFAVTGGGVSRSVDAGQTWAPGEGLPPLVSGSLAMDLPHPDVLYVAGPDSVMPSVRAVYRTEDGGLHWSATGSFFRDKTVMSVAVDPGSSRVFAATDQGIFRSADGGASWSSLLAGSFSTVAAIRPSELYASAWGDAPQVFRSTDGGDHWAAAGLPAGMVATVFAASPAAPTTVFTGSWSGVLKAADGTSWVAANDGLRGFPAVPVMNPGDPATLYAPTYLGGLFRSGDGGGTWTVANSSSSLSSVAVQPGSLALFSRLGESLDGGTTWTAVAYPFGAVSAPVIVPTSPQTFFLASPSRSPAQVSRSLDGGAHWTTSLDTHFNGDVSFLVASASGGDVFATVTGLPIRALFQSRDGGDSWQDIDASGWPADWFFSTFGVLAVDPSNRSIVYAVASGRLWMSRTGGGQWQDISAGLPATTALQIVSDLVIDPTAPATLYASTPTGVFRSPDRGTTWVRFSDGLPEGPASGLVIDATGRLLHVAAAGGIYDFTISAPCTVSPKALCLLSGRFVATVEAIDPRTGRLEVGTAVGQDDQYGYFSLPGFTGDPNFPEVVLKMVDATAMGDGFWVFHSGLTDLQYTLSILDTATGRQKSYQNDRSDPQSLCGGADTGTFTEAPIATAAAAPRAARVLPGEGMPSLTLLGRFDATLTAFDPRTGRTENGLALAQDARWGYFSLPGFTGAPSFPEVFVKMLDGTELGGFFWLFHTGLTDLEYTLTVTDKTDGAQRTYRNERSDPARLCGGADTAAFHE